MTILKNLFFKVIMINTNSARKRGYFMKGKLLTLITAISLSIGAFSAVPAPTNIVANAEETAFSDMNADISMTFDSSSDNAKTFAFKATENGYGNISIKNANIFSYDTARVVIRDDTGLSMSISNTTNGSTGELAITKDHIYNVQVECLSYFKPTFVLNFHFNPSDQWEKENNNSAELANVIEPNKEYYGSLYGNGDDVDYYKILLNKDSQLNLSFGPKNIENNIDPWYIDIINSSSKSINVSNGVAISTEYPLTLKKGTYYLKVYKIADPAVIPYKISYKISELKISKPSISKVNGNRYKMSGKTYNYIKSIVVKNSGKVSGYTINVSKNKTMKKKSYSGDFAYSKPLSLETYKINGSKILYMTVRPYVIDALGAKIFGKSSKVKKFSLKLK